MFDLIFTIPLEDCTYSNVDMYMEYKYIHRIPCFKSSPPLPEQRVREGYKDEDYSLTHRRRLYI